MPTEPETHIDPQLPSGSSPQTMLLFKSPELCQNLCRIGSTNEVCRRRVYPALVGRAVQEMRVDYGRHRLIDSAKGRQFPRRRSPETLDDCLSRSQRLALRRPRQESAGGDLAYQWLTVSTFGKPLSASGIGRPPGFINTSSEYHGEINIQPWDVEAEAPDSPRLLSLSGADRKRSSRLASAVGLIMGTAVGPGILGLPAATVHAGLIPSTVTIVAAWVYVMASILLVAELSYAVMAEQGGAEVSFTGLAVRTLGHTTGRVVAVVYALLNYALLVACVAGLRSILEQWLRLHPALLCILSPGVVVSMLAFARFGAVDLLNRALCALMLASITSLVVIGIIAGRDASLGFMGFGTLSLNAVFPSIPVIVLTLGFHVITPVVCHVVGGTPQEARKAILCGGSVPLVMVLAWNSLVVGLAPAHATTTSFDPIKFLLSMSSEAAPVVQAFAFAALGTTLIGYALSFPKQLIDTGSLFGISSQAEAGEITQKLDPSRRLLALLMAIAPPVAVAITFPTAFASALDFAGVYANCFLFGVLPPVMAWAYRYHQPQAVKSGQARLVSGGRFVLISLLLIALFLGFRT